MNSTQSSALRNQDKHFYRSEISRPPEFKRRSGITNPHIYIYIWVFPRIGVPQNGWFIRENPIKTATVTMSL